jgi:bacterioferritin-associated ferredoxin
MQLPLVVEIKGRDRLEVTSLKPFQMKITGCHSLHKKLSELRTQFGGDLSQWPLQNDFSHVGLLINELILKIKEKWNHPYPHDEVCHCRNVTLETVEQAIMNGAETPEMVSKWTMASTACGTCRPDVEKILKYRRSI